MNDLLLFRITAFVAIFVISLGFYRSSERFGKLPEENMTATELIEYNGFPVQVHHPITEDGYILTMQRIPWGRNHPSATPSLNNSGTCKLPVLLMHGLASTSTNWLTNLPNQSLAYILADNNYDVWLGNVRGNKYSKEHVNLTVKDSDYWRFSWEEMAEYDLPAMVNYILNETMCDQIAYVGHSQGTLIGFAKFSSDPVFAKKIKLFVALAPVSTVKYITSPVKYFAPFTWGIQKTIEMFGDYSLGGLSWLLTFVKPACELEPEAMLLCENVIFYIAGAESISMLNQLFLPQTRIPIYLAHNPDDTSMKNLIHFGQMVNSGRMQKYDYGFLKNMAVYGQLYPPDYYPELMDVKTAVFWSTIDALSDPQDVRPLLEKIQKLRLNVQLENFSHLDFLWSLEAHDKVYCRILELLKE